VEPTLPTNKTRKRVVPRVAAAAVAAVTFAVMAGCSSSPSSSGTKPSTGTSSSPSGTVASYPRSQTLYTSGTMYSPPTSWNPFNVGNYATGTQGLIYEPLFLFDPINNNSYKPWLATSGTWNGNTYTLQVRNNVKWSNGTPLTGADVAFSIKLAMSNANNPYHANVASVKTVTASGNTVTVVFSGAPAYSEFQDYLWEAPVVDQATWSKVPASQLVSFADNHPVGTGPMLLDTYSASQEAFKVNPSWWGTSQLGLTFKFKYLVDVVNGSNNVQLSLLTAGQLDWSNNFLPGVNTLISGLGGTGGYGMSTFYKNAPYMLSANTAWLEPNTTKAPMNNVNFRKALAYAVNPQQIVSSVYSGLVKAADPTGLLPTLNSYIDQNVVKQYGFSYNPTLAKQYLAKSGYNGRNITIEVPDGWTDWMAAIQVIVANLKAVGINATPIYPQFTARQNDLVGGNFDLAIDNNAQLDSTPWSYFQRVYQLPIPAQNTTQLNWERFSSPKDWALVQQAGTTPLTDTAKLQSIYSQLESDFLQQLPVIPVWYNGAWFQAINKVWTGYPASGTSNQNTPLMWRNYLGAMTSIYALTSLKPAPPAAP
jgi:peptide/nickel transport system substrate-binding protein